MDFSDTLTEKSLLGYFLVVYCGDLVFKGDGS
jgi:hypothetical protein